MEGRGDSKSSCFLPLSKDMHLGHWWTGWSTLTVLMWLRNGYLSLYVHPMMSRVSRLSPEGSRDKLSMIGWEKVKKDDPVKGGKLYSCTMYIYSFTPAPSCSIVLKPDPLISMVTVSTHFSGFALLYWVGVVISCHGNWLVRLDDFMVLNFFSSGCSLQHFFPHQCL